jgi:phosphatidylserine decarboxylase
MYRLTFRKRNPILFFILLISIAVTLISLGTYSFASFLIISWLLLEYMYRLPVFSDPDKLQKLDNKLGLYIDKSLQQSRVISPCYGTVQAIETTKDSTRIICTIGILDVHYLFVPIRGSIKDIQSFTGESYLSYLLDRSGKNARKEALFTNGKGLEVKVIGYRGFMSGEIRTTVRNGEKVYAGKSYGVLPLDARVDIILPNTYDKKGVTLLVKKGDHLNGPHSPLCVY